MCCRQKLLRAENTRVEWYRFVTMPYVLYGWQSWSVVLKEEQAEGVWEQGAEEHIRA
jgi:hypothetical protein